MERAHSLAAIPCGTCVREHSGGHPPKSRPSRHPGRAPPGHGGGHGRRPSAPHAGTPGNGGPASTHPAPRRADSQRSRFPVRQVAARARAPPPAGRARRGRRRGEELKIWNPGNLGVRERPAGSQVSRFPARRLALAPATAAAGLRLADAVIRSPQDLVQRRQPPRRAVKRACRAVHTRNRIGCRYTPRHGGRRVNDTPTEREAESTWTRLRRRKVVQWGVVYVAAAWGFLQGLEYVSETFHWPEQLRQIAFLALLIGLPIVLVLAWYHGDRGQQRISTPEFAILTLLLLLGGGAFWYYQRASRDGDGCTLSPHRALRHRDRCLDRRAALREHEPDKEQEYFADGISEELLNLLAQVPELRVIARTSSFSFKGKDVDIAEIARRLNVANVLEGSVRKSGDTLAHHRAARPSLRQLAPVVADLRPPADRHLRRAGRDRRRRVSTSSRSSCSAAHRSSRVTDPTAYALFLQARQIGRRAIHARGFEQADCALPAGARDRSVVCGGLGWAWQCLRQPSGRGLRLRRRGLSGWRAKRPTERSRSTQTLRRACDARLDRDRPTIETLAAAAQHLEHALALEPANPDIIGDRRAFWRVGSGDSIRRLHSASTRSRAIR